MSYLNFFSSAVGPNASYVFDFAAGPTPHGTGSDSDQTVTWSSLAVGVNRAQFTVTAISGKVYCEFEITSKDSSHMYHAIGIGKKTEIGFYNATNYDIYSRKPNTVGGCSLGFSGYYTNGTDTTSTPTYDYSPGDRIGVAVDTATGKVWYSKNGTWISGDPAAGTGQTHTLGSGTFYFAAFTYTCTGTGTVAAKIFPYSGVQLYSAPSGFSPYQP